MSSPNDTLPLGRRTAVLLFLASATMVLSGCATITRGTKEAIVIESEPSGAQVRLSNGFTGTTPTSSKVPRKGDLTVTISREGYETVNMNLTTQVAGAGAAGMAGNVLVGGIIGVGIDAYSGGMLEHKPNPVKVNLVPVKTAVATVPAPTEQAPKGQPAPDPVAAPANTGQTDTAPPAPSAPRPAVVTNEPEKKDPPVAEGGPQEQQSPSPSKG